MAAKQLDIHQHYLFSGLVDDDGVRIPNQYKPVFNQLMLAADPKAAQLKSDKPVILRTNSVGLIKGVQNNSLKGHLAYNQLLKEKAKTEGKKPDLPVIIPPLEVALYHVMTDPDKWTSEFLATMKKEATEKGALKPTILKWVTFSHKQLAKPNEVEPLSAEDIQYRDWYNEKKSVKKFVGYFLPKKRGLFFTFSNKDMVKQIEKIEIKLPNYKEGDKPEVITDIKPSETNDFLVGFLSGSEDKLPVGMYTFTVIFGKTLPSGDDHWSGNVSGKDTTQKTINKKQPSYSLSAMGRFDLNVPSGDFCLINADPISLEESLVNQYPVQYAHIIEAANEFKHLAKMKKGPTTGPSSGLSSFVQNLGLAKSYIDLANDIGTSSGKLSLAVVVLEGYIMPNFQRNMNEDVYNSIAAAFSLKKTVGAVKKYHKAVEEALNTSIAGGWKPVGTKDFFTDWTLGTDDAGNSKYANTVGKYLKIPEEVFAGLGKLATVAGTVNTALAVADAYQGVGRANKNAKNAVEDLQTIVDDYMKKTGFRTLVQKEILINFDTGKHDIKAEYIGNLNVIAKELILHKTVVMVIEGHTDWIGSEKDNQALSERRAQAVKDKLVELGVEPDTRITAIGRGELSPIAPNDTDAGKEANRRIISNYLTPSEDGTACREGMQSCEQYRNLTLSTYLAELDSYVEMASKIMDACLAILTAFPLTAPAALAITVIKAVGENATAINRVFESEDVTLFRDAEKVKKQMRHESSANQFMTRKMFVDKKVDDLHLPVIQTRLRAEAINGLMNLIIRAVATIEDEADTSGGDRKSKLTKKLENYHVKEYINNFILNDQWLFPLKTLSFSTLSMDQMWLFATSKYNNEIDGVKNIKLSNGFSLNDQWQLIKHTNLTGVVASGLGITYIRKLLTEDHVVRESLLDATQMASLFNASLPSDVKADFQNVFPIHHFSTKDVETLTENFQISWPNITTKVYKYSAVYVRESSKDSWVLLSDKKKQIEALESKKKGIIKAFFKKNMGIFTIEPLSKSQLKEISDIDKDILDAYISPYHQFKILVVFNEGDDGITGFVPVNLQLHRVDGHNGAGPVYKGLAKVLQKEDLEGLSTPGITTDKLVGQYACVFSPWYQFGTLSISGIKPMVSSQWLSVLGRAWYDDMEDYYKGGNLDGMRYGLQVNVGKGTKSKVWLPINPTVYEDIKGFTDPKDKFDNDDIIEILEDDTPNEFPYNLSKSRMGEAMMLQKEFLLSNSASDTTDPLFGGRVVVTPLIRINGEGNPWIMGHSVFEEDIKHYKTSPKITLDGNDLLIDEFQWRESVEFVFIVCSSKLLLDSYLKKGKPFLRAQGGVTLSEDAIHLKSNDCTGPTFNNLNFDYLGKCDNGKAKTPSYVFQDGMGIGLPKYFQYRQRPKADKRKELAREPVHHKEIADIIDILKANNGPGAKGKEDEPALKKMFKISGYPDVPVSSLNNYRDPKNEGEMFYYAAYKKMEYTNPKGKKIDSIRPFGDNKFSKTGVNHYPHYRYEFKDFNLVNTNLSVLEQGWNNIQFHFSSPKQFLKDQPWTEHPDEQSKQIIAAMYKKKMKPDTNTLSYKDANEWIKDHSTELKPRVIESILTDIKK